MIDRKTVNGLSKNKCKWIFQTLAKNVQLTNTSSTSENADLN